MLENVNILTGTASTFERSHGNTLPIVARPFGMAHWTMQTRAGTSFFFHADDPRIQGIRLTHQPSPWMDDYGSLVLMPQAGPLILPAAQRASCYRQQDSELSPHRMNLQLLRYQISLEMTPTERGALLVIGFPAGGARRLILEPQKGESEASVLPGDRRIVGFTRGHSGGTPANFACYYAMEFSAPIERAGTFVGGKPADGLRAAGDRSGAFVEFPAESLSVEVRIATSFISIDQAKRNLQQELAGRDLAALIKEAAAAWEEVLGRVAIETEDEEKRRTFYGCLYRCFLFPRIFHEFDGGGAMVHYSPCDGNVYPGPLYTDTGFWDTYRTLFPLLNLLDRPRSAEMMEGFLNYYREGGWLSQWSSPGPRGVMIGTHSDAVLAHAIGSGITGFDWETAYAAMRRNCMDVPGRNEVGRAGLRDYIDLGYVPADSVAASVSMTQDYAYGDYCLAAVAEALGHKEDARDFSRRSGNYKNVWDPGVGFMRGRNRDGSWAAFDPLEWGGPYVEGGPWQHSWAVPHDPHGLIALIGGRKRCIAKLDQLIATPPVFHTGSYVDEIHEMTEMALAGFGQYAHSNQPVHHVLYLYTLAGSPVRTRHRVRRVLAELYSSGPQGFCGDEDNGEMSAWYVLSSLGLFPFCPGSGSLLVGGLNFDRATIRPAGASELIVEPVSLPDGTSPVPELEGQRFPDFQIPISDLVKGGTLRIPFL
ncbi:MAG: GH92 family glycosyl hydrolase [Verrucomicrobiae bacterium]